jgi:hypothetical protein
MWLRQWIPTSARRPPFTGAVRRMYIQIRAMIAVRITTQLPVHILSVPYLLGTSVRSAGKSHYKTHTSPDQSLNAKPVPTSSFTIPVVGSQTILAIASCPRNVDANHLCICGGRHRNTLRVSPNRTAGSKRPLTSKKKKIRWFTGVTDNMPHCMGSGRSGGRTIH